MKTAIFIKKALSGIGFLLCFVLCSKPSYAVLDLEYLNSFEEVRVYRDFNNHDQYYYSPGRIELSKNSIGKPEFKFLQMRYSGSAATGDQGKFLYKSILQLTVNFQGVNAEDLDAIRNYLGLDPNILLSPLPIHNVDAHLIYASIDNATKDQRIDGQIENLADDEGKGDVSSWQKKTFTVSLDDSSSQLFWDALKKGNTVISFSYEYHSMCYLRGKESIVQVESNDPSANPDSLLNAIVPTGSLDSSTIVDSKNLVYANSSAIEFDAKKYPELLIKIDINESRVPPDFAVLEVRCYDFRNELAEGLYAKNIEIEATGMNNKTVKQKITFYSYDKTTYHSVRFPYAVKMNLPFRYRIVEIKEDGSRLYSEWTTQKSWNKLLDITSRNN